MSDLPVTDLISVAQAIGILDATEIKPPVVSMPLQDAMGLHLAEDVFADRDYPPFDKAVMDGFAIRSGTGSRFSVIETIIAGQMPRQSIGPGQAMAIMTGAPLPAGADAVVPVEWTYREGTFVTIDRDIKKNHAIARRGSDTQSNQLLLSRGTCLGAVQIAVAASVGKSNVTVHPAPVVAVLSTGDELIDIDETPTGSQITNSNGPMMMALLRRLGCTVRNLGIVRDNPDEMRQAIESGLQADALFITGGMSMGERDYVPGLLRSLGLDVRISKLRIKPGKPFVFATARTSKRLNPTCVFGLPGNPVSAYVCTVRLASRILAKLSGEPFAFNPVSATVTDEMSANGNREFYIPCRHINGQATPLRSNGSADLFTLALANALIVRPENASAANAGDSTRIIHLP